MFCKNIAESKLTHKKTALFIGVVYTYSAIMAVTPLLGWDNYGLENFHLACR